MSAVMVLRYNDTKTVQALLALPKKGPARVARALNRAGGSMNTAMARDISKDTKLKVGVVKENLKQTKATGTRLNFQLSVSGKRIPVEDFNARGPMPSLGKGRGVRANTPARVYPRAFRARMPKTGHIGVFQRVGQARLPIRELFGPSLPHVFVKFSPATLERGQEQLTKNLQSEYNFLIKEIGAQSA